MIKGDTNAIELNDLRRELSSYLVFSALVLLVGTSNNFGCSSAVETVRMAVVLGVSVEEERGVSYRG